MTVITLLQNKAIIAILLVIASLLAVLATRKSQEKKAEAVEIQKMKPPNKPYSGLKDPSPAANKWMPK